MQEDFQALLIQPIPMTPFALTDSLFSPTFQDLRFSYLKDSKEYFCADPDVQRQQSARARKPLPEKVMNIVKKSQQQRTTTDNNVLYRYLLTSNFFKELAKQLSPEVVKQILKEGKIKFYHSGDLLSSCGKKIKAVRILLHGQVGIMFEEEKDETEMDLWSSLHHLVEKLGRETKNFKLKPPGHNKKKNLFQSGDKSLILRRETIKSEFDIDELKTIEAETLLDYASLLNYEPKCSQTLIVTVDSTLIMTLAIDQFYQSLLVFYNSKQNQIIKLFRNVPIFNSFQNSKLKILVEKLNITEMKKNQYVYREGNKPTCFYLLTEGEVEITKTIDILEENPNNFYKNRMKVRKQKNHLNIKVLPYANFNGVYNYQKQSKMITLALINPISVFGQQELIEKTPREVNAKIISLTAKMYEISLSDIQEFCTKISGVGQNDSKMTIMDFFLLIQDGITIKKILFRQNQLSEMLHHQNKDKSKRIFQDPVQQSNLSRSRIAGKRRSASTVVPFRKISLKEEEAPPAFNNFNFTQFLAQNQEMYQSLPQKMLTIQETNVMRLTHTKVTSAEDSPKKNKVKDKTIRFRNLSKDMYRNSNSKIAIDNVATIDSLTPIPPRSNSASKSAYIHKITLDDPLFTVNYFKTQNELQRKLFVKAKKTKLDTIYKNSKDKHQFN